MKIVFVGDKQDSTEHETEEQGLKQIFQMADKLSDTELAKLEAVINRLPEITKDKNYD